MPRSSRPRKAYRPQGVRPDSHLLAQDLVTVLSPAQQAALIDPARAALEAMRTGQGSWDAWRALADACNVCQALAQRGIGSNLLGKALDAQKALAAVADRAKQGGSFTLRGPELTDLGEAVWLHEVQLKHASQGELRAAIERTQRVARGVLSGNGSTRAHIVVGQLH